MTFAFASIDSTYSLFLEQVEGIAEEELDYVEEYELEEEAASLDDDDLVEEYTEVEDELEEDAEGTFT